MSIVAPTAKASDIQMDYMNLLVTELKNQNPLEPLDNKEMASQLAQFSQLQQLETMNSRFAGILATAERSCELVTRQRGFVPDYNRHR